MTYVYRTGKITSVSITARSKVSAVDANDYLQILYYLPSQGFVNMVAYFHPTTSYADYTETHTEPMLLYRDWEWGDIDEIHFGVMGYVGDAARTMYVDTLRLNVVSDGVTYTFKPSGDSLVHWVNVWSLSGAATIWGCTEDDDAKYIYCSKVVGGYPYSMVTKTNLPVDVDYFCELATTQVYAVVTSEVTATSSCRLPKPIDIKVNHDIDTTGLNFWSGNRDVFAEGRSSKRTTLSGIMWDGCTDGVSTCEDIIHCIRALGKLQQPITIGGLRYADLNVEYNILSFSWKQQSECTNIYDWNLELEFTQ
jgi:hypothetical protein